MAAPGGKETSKPLGLALAFATAALFFALSACGPSQKKEGKEGASAAPSASSTSPTSSPAGTAAAPQSASAASTRTMPTAPTAEGEQDAVDIGSITIESDDGANNGAAIAVDLVFVYDPALIPQLEAESADAWFKVKAAMAASAGNNLAIMSWTVPAGDEVPETPVDAHSGALAAFVFANYSGKGDHRLRIDGSGALTVTLGVNDPTFEVDQ